MSAILKRLEFIAGLLPENQIAIEDGSESLTYKELFERINHCAQWLFNHDVKCLGLNAGNSIDWVIADLACQEASVICVPIPAFFSEDQLRRCITSSGVDCLLTHAHQLKTESFQPNLTLDAKGIALGTKLQSLKIQSSARAVYPDGTQKITYTSGSTGNPKGVCLSLEHQWSVAQSLADTLPLKRPRHLCLLPLATLLENIAGIYSPFLSGGTVVVPDDKARGIFGSSSIDVQALLKCISSYKPDSIILIPQLLGALVQAASDGWVPPDSLKFIAVGGGRVSLELIFQARSLGLPVYQGYGLSECGSVVALNTPEEDQINSVGKILPHGKVTIASDGEIIVTGAVFLGYLGAPETWHPTKVKTGDLGSLKHNYLQVQGRKKNILITSFGRNISPEWVESEILSSPFIQQCMVVGDGRPYLTALVSSDEMFPDQHIERWIQEINSRLPDYAQVHQWQRVKGKDLLPLLTDNGRLKRSLIEGHFAHKIDAMYSQESLQPDSRMVMP